jgi:protein regulator of cytokinesis 1
MMRVVYSYTKKLLLLIQETLNSHILTCTLSKQPEKMTGTLKEQLDSITPALREMRLRKDDRVKIYRVQGQIQKISAEIAGQPEYNDSPMATVNENDLSLKKLEEYQVDLQRLHNEKVPKE